MICMVGWTKRRESDLYRLARQKDGKVVKQARVNEGKRWDCIDRC